MSPWESPGLGGIAVSEVYRHILTAYNIDNINTKDGKFQLNSVDDEYEYEGKPSIVSYSFCMRHQGPFHSTRATKNVVSYNFHGEAGRGRYKERRKRKEKKRTRKGRPIDKKC